MTLHDFVWDVLVVGGVVGLAVGLLANAISHVWFGSHSRGTSDKEAVRKASATALVKSGWRPRRWLYFLASVVALLASLLLWTAFWFPLLQASVIAGLSQSYSTLVSLVSALLYLIAMHFALGPALSLLLQYESQFQNKRPDVRRVFTPYVFGLGGTCAVFVIFYGSLAVFMPTLFSPTSLMAWLYGSVFATYLVWLVMMFLSRNPWLLKGFGDSDTDAEYAQDL